MNVLLVDDEPMVLSTLERVISDRAPRWRVTTARGARDALARMADTRFDAVVVDMWMPQMDGAQLLREVATQWPDTARLALSGRLDEDTAMQVAPVAHQFLAKPCAPGEFMGALSRVEAVQRGLDPETRRALGRLTGLPCLPTVLRDVRRALDRPGVDAHALAALIRRDPSLTARMLRTANSAFFSRGAFVNDLPTAISRLGQRMVHNLTVSETLLSQQGPRMGLTALSQRSFEAALAVDLLAPPARRAQASLAALVCNLGTVAMAHMAPTRYDAMVRDVILHGSETLAAERKYLGVHHTAVGGYLLRLWGFDPAIARAVEIHHDPPTEGDDALLAAATHLSSHLVDMAPLDVETIERAGWTEEHVHDTLSAVWASE